MTLKYFWCHATSESLIYLRIIISDCGTIATYNCYLLVQVRVLSISVPEWPHGSARLSLQLTGAVLPLRPTSLGLWRGSGYTHTHPHTHSLTHTHTHTHPRTHSLTHTHNSHSTHIFVPTTADRIKSPHTYIHT